MLGTIKLASSCVLSDLLLLSAGTPAGPGKHICGFSMGSVSLHGNEKNTAGDCLCKIPIFWAYFEILIFLFKVHVLVHFAFSQFGVFWCLM